jgi:integral membrane protein
MRSPSTSPARDPGRVVDRRLLLQYRVMAFTTATLLIVLVFAGLPLQFAAGKPEVANVVGTMHGFLYLVYLFVAFRLTRSLGIPKWQMVLVLLAGTVPFCAFVAERKLTRRFEAQAQELRLTAGGDPEGRVSLKTFASSVRKRWFSRRALLLHVEVAIVAPGCVAAGWWQATRALAGNQLSWVYSIEWPIFALLALAGWWHLVHEDPEAYRARRARSAYAANTGTGTGTGTNANANTATNAVAAVAAAATSALSAEAEAAEAEAEAARFEGTAARLAAALALLVGAEFALGAASLFYVPFSRPSGWLPAKGEAVYLAHAIFGILVAVGAAVLLMRVRHSTRTSRTVGWVGFIGVALAGIGGLISEAQSLLRFLGVVLMFVGPTVAAFAYLIPTLLKRQHKTPAAELNPSHDM